MVRINEHDEFLLSRLLDGDLPAAEAEALRRRIEAEPALAAVYARMVRLDGVLKGRAGDRPQVDWRAFHARVLNRVELAAEENASPLFVRVSRWLAIGVPLAAAAVIALVFILRSPGGKPAGGPGPAPLPGGTLVVVVERPVPVVPAAEGSIKVSFKRSQQLAEATWQADAIADEQPRSLISALLPGGLPLELADVILGEPPL